MTDLKPTEKDTALRLLARMIARAYLEDARDRSNGKQCLEVENQFDSTLPLDKLTAEQLAHFASALTACEEKLNQRKSF